MTIAKAPAALLSALADHNRIRTDAIRAADGLDDGAKRECDVFHEKGRRQAAEKGS